MNLRSNEEKLNEALAKALEDARAPMAARRSPQATLRWMRGDQHVTVRAPSSSPAQEFLQQLDELRR